MLVTEITRNIHEEPLPAGIHMEVVTLPSAQLVKRILRVRTDHGHEVGIRLPQGAPDLKDGDVLDLSEKNAIVIKVESTDVLVIKARSIYEMAVTAHTLGNRHLQAQFFDADSEFGAEVMVVQYDHTVAEYLDHAGVPYEHTEHVMLQPFRHSEHTH
ncbi:MAG TPA: urease accessory protein UreE [Actinomycetaceae bacterium]|nr:urease accessory protein UreE [Actinomycetaceae bacterium]